MVGGLHVAAEVGPIDLNRLAGPAQLVALNLRRHRLTQLVGQHEGRLVLHVQVAGERQGGLALDLVAEDHGGGKVSAERQLVEGEQGAAGQAEILAARLAAEPELAGRAAGFVARRAGAVRAYGLAVRGGPADRPEHLLCLGVRHPQHGGDAERAGLGGEEEVLRHWAYSL